jgi:hypothetical protein
VYFLLEKRLTVQQILNHEFFGLGITPTTIPVSALTIAPCFDTPQVNKPVNSSLSIRQPLKALLNNNLNTAISGPRKKLPTKRLTDSALKKPIIQSEDKSKNDKEKKPIASSSDRTELKKQAVKLTAKKSMETNLKKSIVQSEGKGIKDEEKTSNQKTKSVEPKPSAKNEEKLKSELCEGKSPQLPTLSRVL